MALTKSNKLGEDIYKKEVFYIDTKGLIDSLYSQPEEFRSFLSRGLAEKFTEELSLESLVEDEKESERRKPRKRGKNSTKNPKALKGKVQPKKPVIDFFSQKAEVLKEEIEKINRDMDSRKEIFQRFRSDIGKDNKEVKRLLQEISLYSSGTKHSIDLRRMDLERSMLGLSKEMRISELALWKDLVFLRRELREIIFEYQALKRISELVES